MIDDVLTYALFPQIGLKYLKNRNNPEAFEPAPSNEPLPTEQVPAPKPSGKTEHYSISVDGKVYAVSVAPSGELTNIQPAPSASSQHTDVLPQSASVDAAETLNSPLSGNIFKVNAKPGQQVVKGDVVIIMEAMKMETEVRAAKDGTIAEIFVSEGDSVATGEPLLSLA